MRILYIGESQTHDFYVQGLVPSHWLYGAVEMEKEGNEVIWEQESTGFIADLKYVISYHPDLIFIPNLNLHNHFLLLFVCALGLFPKPVYAYLHHEPKVKKGIKSILYKFLLSGCRHVFFLSELTMKETVANGLLSKMKCSAPGWGPDRAFYNSIQTSDDGYYISTGKENRDFDLLIEVFKNNGLPLKIYTSKSHAGTNHEYLQERCKGISNIQVVITDNTGLVYPQLLEAMAHAHALVCPLKRNKLKYCVGLSTIADAEGLNKPLIITKNPYHTKERLSSFNVVESFEDWTNATNNLNTNQVHNYSMRQAFEQMKPYMNI